MTSASALVAASMIGVGVYTTSGYTLTTLGSPGAVIVAWIVGGLIAICGAASYGTLAKRFTESGGEYLFLSRSLHPVAGLMAGWVSLLSGFTGAIAIVAHGLETYLTPMLFDSSPLPSGTIAIAVVLAAAVLHTIGVQSAARAQDVVVALKLLLIVGFIVYALFQSDQWPGNASAAADSEDSVSLLTFAQQLVYISFSYLGFNAAVYIAGEIDQPKRNVPRSMLLGTLIVTVIYVALNAIFVLAPTFEVATSEANRGQIAAVAAMAVGGQKFATLVSAVIVVSLFTSASALVMTGPRVYAKMAEDGFFPRWFTFRDRPPAAAIWFQAAIAIIAISIANLKELLGYLGLTLSVCSALTVCMLFVLRWKGDLKRLPVFGIAPALYVIATLVLAVLFGISEPKQAIAAAVTVAAGLLVYPWVKNKQVTQPPR